MKTIKIRCTGTGAIGIDKLSRFQGDLKKCTDDNLEKLKSSILQEGFRIPLFVYGKKILDGHTRKTALESLQKDGYTIPDIPIVELEADNEHEAKKLLLLINSRYASIREQGFYDFAQDFDMEELKGIINIPEIRFLDMTETTGENEISEIDSKNAITEKGDLWDIGKHRLLCGDVSYKADVEKVMNGKTADMVFTDPPYGVSIGKKNRMLNSFQKSGLNLTDIKGDDMKKEDLYKMLVCAFTNIRGIMADESSIYVTSPQGGELGLMMMMMMQESGLGVKHIINWIKNLQTFSMGRLDYEYKHEPILYTWKKTHKFYAKGKHLNSCWEINKPTNSKLHPTMKPVELMENAILNSSKEGQIVFDGFIGSGSTIIACEKTGRICMGTEISPHYCDVIVKRYCDYCKANSLKCAIKRNGKDFNPERLNSKN